MSASILKSSSIGLERFFPLRRFLRRQDGAAAIEFGIVALPFLLLLFMIMETGLVFFANQTLETAVADSARLIRTGQAQGFDAEAFRKQVCTRATSLFKCDGGIFVDVQAPTGYDTIDRTIKRDVSGNPITQYAPGAQSAKAIVVVRAMYAWPIVSPLTQKFLADDNSTSRMLVATAVFRNEPF
jgi:Flp pilus assembly protein TadG